MITSLAANEAADALTLDWESGGQSSIPAAFLRREARDAWSIRERLDTGDVAVAPGITITGLFQVGANGVNIHFSDGHDRAIYPYPYLAELSERIDN